MELYLANTGCDYEAENVARIFFPGLRPVKRYPAHGADAVYVRRSRTRSVCAVRRNGRVAARWAPLAPDADKKQAEYAVCRAAVSAFARRDGAVPAVGHADGRAARALSAHAGAKRA